jgi:hypothetical protein
MRLFVAGLVVWGAVLFAAAFAQTRPSASAFTPGVAAIGILHAIFTRSAISRRPTFYRDVFGLSAEARRLDNPTVPTLTNLPGAAGYGRPPDAACRIQIRAQPLLAS